MQAPFVKIFVDSSAFEREILSRPENKNLPQRLPHFNYVRYLREITATLLFRHQILAAGGIEPSGYREHVLWLHYVSADKNYSHLEPLFFLFEHIFCFAQDRGDEILVSRRIHGCTGNRVLIHRASKKYPQVRFQYEEQDRN
jgi:hypothetical protein